jgi:hypothetical protein
LFLVRDAIAHRRLRMPIREPLHLNIELAVKHRYAPVYRPEDRVFRRFNSVFVILGSDAMGVVRSHRNDNKISVRISARPRQTMPK